MSLHKVIYILVFVGALNWGLIGLFDFNLVSFFFGYSPMMEKLIYVLVGVSAVLDLKSHTGCCSECSVEMMGSKKKKKR